MGSEEALRTPEFVSASANHRSAFTTLRKHLREAKYEHYLMGTEREYHLERKLIICMQVCLSSCILFVFKIYVAVLKNFTLMTACVKRLAQHIGGLQSASKAQLNLLRQHTNSEYQTGATMTPNMGSGLATATIFTPPAHSYMSPIFGSSAIHTPTLPEFSQLDAITEGIATSQEVLDSLGIFDQFICHLGPPMVLIPPVWYGTVTDGCRNPSCTPLKSCSTTSPPAVSPAHALTSTHDLGNP